MASTRGCGYVLVTRSRERERERERERGIVGLIFCLILVSPTRGPRELVWAPVNRLKTRFLWQCHLYNCTEDERSLLTTAAAEETVNLSVTMRRISGGFEVGLCDEPLRTWLTGRQTYGERSRETVLLSCRAGCYDDRQSRQTDVDKHDSLASWVVLVPSDFLVTPAINQSSAACFSRR